MFALDQIRTHFPAFDHGAEPRFFENAGGSFPCRETTDALAAFYRDTKVQPYAVFPASAQGGQAMDRSHERWAQALGVANDEVIFGPSTSMNTYVLANAMAGLLSPGDEVVVTNQDHEANTGATRRMAEAVGATVREWKIDPDSGLLDVKDLDTLLSSRTAVITFPHCSNIVGVENDATAICARAKAVGAISIVDGVSFAPHGFPDVPSIDADVYLFSLYKCFSVHQGLMVVRRRLAERLTNQSHFFNSSDARKRFVPAGPDHAQVAAAGAVLDYVDATFGGPNSSLRQACDAATTAWHDHEATLATPVLQLLSEHKRARLLGPVVAAAGLHRCPTVAFVPASQSCQVVSDSLVAAGIMTSWGDFYASRTIEGMGVDPTEGVVRVSWVHYTSQADIDHLLNALEAAL